MTEAPRTGFTTSGGVTQLPMVAEPESARAEAIRALRTHIIAQHLEAGRRALVVCSPHADAGCTFVAANLSVSLAQVGINTLLINADMRGPGLETYLPPAHSELGLRQTLTMAERTPMDAIEREVLPNLSVLHSGGVAPNPLELLGDHRFGALMTACLRDYDMTIIDTPPANGGADVLRISSVVGYSLIVARDKQTRVVDVEDARQGTLRRRRPSGWGRFSTRVRRHAFPDIAGEGGHG